MKNLNDKYWIRNNRETIVPIMGGEHWFVTFYFFTAVASRSSFQKGDRQSKSVGKDLKGSIETPADTGNQVLRHL